MCPVLYDQAWDKAYGAEAGYEEIFLKKFNTRQRDLETPACTQKPKSEGSEKDLIAYWKKLYRQKQWQRYAPFQKTRGKGNFNIPYVLLKAKNMQKDTRDTKWYKARPIAPQTKHPMRKLFHIVGRAWSFVTANLPGEHFAINHGGGVPDWLRENATRLAQHGEVSCEVMDMEGCFTNMPKDPIKFGLRDLTKRITRTTGHTGVAVPNKANMKCEWVGKSRKKVGITKIPFEVMLEVIEFCLDNTFIKDRHGGLRRQVKGIPMGDPNSPGMCIGACAWMEMEWMSGLSRDTKKHFRSIRYMDDVLTLTARNPRFDEEKFKADFHRSECYWEPLHLEDGGAGTFLETSFTLAPNGSVTHWLKNVNDPEKETKVWRYAHYHSYTPWAAKRSILVSTLKKVDKMASDGDSLVSSALWKLAEFAKLRYPIQALLRACTLVAVTTRNATWFKVRGAFSKYAYRYLPPSGDGYGRSRVLAN